MANRSDVEVTDEQLEEAERIIGYYECHSDNERACGWVLEDSIKLLRELLPDWSAFKTANPKED